MQANDSESFFGALKVVLTLVAVISLFIVFYNIASYTNTTSVEALATNSK